MTVPRQSLLVLLASLATFGCGSDIPQPPAGERMSGTVSYAGKAHLSMARPVTRVMLFRDFPPTSSPHAMLNIEHPDFSKPVPYSLAWVTPDRYKVLAQLVDLDAANADLTTLPAAGYPDFCTLSSPDQGFVAIAEDLPIRNVNLTLYDLAGQTDPCNLPTTVCPLQGKGSLDLEVRSTRVPTGADSLVFALFSRFPSTTPASTRKVSGQDLTFPETVIDNKLEPGTYSALYVCFDVGSNSGMGLCTAEDAFVLDGTHPISVVADQITHVIVDLDAATASPAVLESPAEHGCN